VGVGQDECLAGTIAGLPGNRLERPGRSNIEHRTAAAFDHRRYHSATQVHDGRDVDFDHVQLGVRIGCRYWSQRRQSGIVDENVERQPEFGDAGGKVLSRLPIRQVGGQDMRSSAGRLYFFGQGLQLVDASGHQGHLMAAAAQVERDRLAYPGGSAGDQRGAVGCRRWKTHVTTLWVHGSAKRRIR
jgi:hypothetical protein